MLMKIGMMMIIVVVGMERLIMDRVVRHLVVVVGHLGYRFVGIVWVGEFVLLVAFFHYHIDV